MPIQSTSEGKISLAKGIIFTKIGLANGYIFKLWAAPPYPKFSREPPPPVPHTRQAISQELQAGYVKLHSEPEVITIPQSRYCRQIIIIYRRYGNKYKGHCSLILLIFFEKRELRISVYGPEVFERSFFTVLKNMTFKGQYLQQKQYIPLFYKTPAFVYLTSHDAIIFTAFKNMTTKRITFGSRTIHFIV